MSLSPWRYALGFTQVFRRSLLRLSDLWPNSLDEHDSSQPLAHDQWFFFWLPFLAGLPTWMSRWWPIFGMKAILLSVGRRRVPGGRLNIFFVIAQMNIIAAPRPRNAGQSFLTAKDNLEGAWAERAAAAIEYYHRLSWLYAGRSKLYTSANLGDRLKAFRAVLAKGGYARTGGLGRKSLVTDMCLGVPIGHLLRSGSG